MVHLDAVLRPIRVTEDHGEGFPGLKSFIPTTEMRSFSCTLFQSSGFAKVRARIPCFLRFVLVNSGEAPGDDHLDIEVARLHGSLFAGRPFTAVFVRHDAGELVRGLIALRDRAHLVVRSGLLIEDVVEFPGLEGVIGDRKRVIRKSGRCSRRSESICRLAKCGPSCTYPSL